MCRWGDPVIKQFQKFLKRSLEEERCYWTAEHRVDPASAWKTCVRGLKISWNAELDTGLEVCGISLSVTISHNWEGREKQRSKSFAHSHIPLKEFLDIKAGVMTVKVVSLYSRNGCHAHTSRAGVYLSFTELLLHADAVRSLFFLWYSWFTISWVYLYRLSWSYKTS